jgi:hypothetical protein
MQNEKRTRKSSHTIKEVRNMSFGRIVSITVVSSLCVMMALPQALRSTTLLKMSNADLAIDADAIVQGEVTSTWSELGENGRYIYTYGTVAVDQVIKGAQEKEYIVKTPGGRIGEAAMEAPSAPTFKVGDEVILFLLDDPSFESNVLGWEQGLFNIRDGVVVQNGMNVVDFIAEIESNILNAR